METTKLDSYFSTSIFLLHHLAIVEYSLSSLLTSVTRFNTHESHMSTSISSTVLQLIECYTVSLALKKGFLPHNVIWCYFHSFVYLFIFVTMVVA